MTTLEERLDRAVSAGGELLEVGTVAFPTGAITASDPYFASSARPFERRVARGAYPLELGRIRMQTLGMRTAFARLRLRPGVEVVRNEPATAGPEGWDAYPVDSGLGSFMDDEARVQFLAAMDRFEAATQGANYHRDVLAPDLAQSAPGPGRPGIWAIHRPPATDVEIAIFRSGLGDGSYTSYWGLDETGEPVTLVTDFDLVPPDDSG
jgi:hypothetical protein